MPIKYHLVENKLTSDPDDYYARVEATESLDLNAIAELVAARNPNYSAKAVLDMWATLEDVVGEAIADGKRVNLNGLVSLYASISGVFVGADAVFDPAKQTINAVANPSGALKETLATAKVEKQAAQQPGPVLVSYEDLGSESQNTIITPGNIGTINGDDLKFNAKEEAEGIYFVSTKKDGTSRKVTAVQQNKPAKLIFLNPDLDSGTYRLEVRARPYKTGDLRTGILQPILTVGA